MPVSGEPIGTFANFLTARLATGGGLGNPADVGVLQAAGITAVCDARIEFDDGQLLAASGITYLWNGTADDGQPKPTEWFARALGFSLPLLAQPHTRVLYHCAAGVNRGPSLAYAALRALGFDPNEALRVVKAGRPQAQIAYAVDAERALPLLGYV